MSNVFISHRTSDAIEAESLAEELRSHGHATFFDTWDIQLGDSIIQKMAEGLEGATFLALCFSASGVYSPWMSREWMSALARQLNGEQVRLLPVRLPGGGNVPAILADIKYADLQRDWDKGIAELLQVIS